MQHWLSYHFQPLETQDVFLTRAFRPFLERYIWPEKQRRAFFIRYEDEHGPHLRLRLREAPNATADTLKPAFEAWMQDRGEWREVPYEPEAERFGGAEVMDQIEEHFQLSTRVALDRLNRSYTYGDAMFDTLRTHSIMAFATGITREKAGIYFGRLCQHWLPMFFQAESGSASDLEQSVLEDFAKVLAPQQAALQETLTDLWEAMQKGQLEQAEPEWRRWLLGNQMILPALGVQLERALPSLLHLHANRLGINNQDEVYLHFILSKTLV